MEREGKCAIIDGGRCLVAYSTSNDSNMISVYDTLYTDLDEDTLKLILYMFGSSRKIRMEAVQKQKGYKDCGVFAIAVCTALANNLDVSNVQFTQTNMRGHLLHCFETMLMIPFP